MPDTDKRPMAPAPVKPLDDTAAQSPAPAATGSASYDPASLPPAAQRALAEAEARRRASATLDLPPELGGRDGPEPVRYGDWERKGLAIDF